ncbi:MAG: BRO-N domain-containing protein [Sarcina sp.]
MSKLIDNIVKKKIKWKGENVWVAMEIAEQLEYENSSKVINYFLLSSGLVNGEDYTTISQNDLSDFKDMLASMGISRFKRSPKLVLFYKSGLVEFLKYRNKVSIAEISKCLCDDYRSESNEVKSEMIVKNFNGYDIYTLIWNGKPCWIALEIAKILGYSRPSIAINQCIKGEEFKKGIDYDILVGEEAREVIQPICDTHIGYRKHISTITIFYKSGLLGFINYAHMPIGKIFREWLRTEVFEDVIDMEIGDSISQSKFSIKKDNLSNNNLDNLKNSNPKFEIMKVLNVVDKILDEKDDRKLLYLDVIFKNI